MRTVSPICYFLLLLAAIETVVLATTKWPAGTYGIPRAQSGCPSSGGFTWRTGWRYQDTEDFLPSNAHSSNFHLDASVDKNNLKRSFCMKTDTSGDSSRPVWPKGKYCIYKKGSCPKGLKSGYIIWDDEDWFNKNSKGGVLPDGVYDKDTKLYYCCRTDGNKAEPIELPTTKPFFLVAYESAACQQVKWARASSEWIRFDTEEDDDGYGGAYPYGAGLNDHTIHYCYYTSCNYTLTKSSGSFQSPNYPNSYPAGQYCSWRIKVPEGLQVVLTFPKFSLQKGTNTDNVQLYDGQNETSPSLGVYSGSMTPPPSGVRSSSNELFVIFKTDNKSNFAGFLASYTAQRPTQPPTTVKTTTTLRTTKATTPPVQTTIKPTTEPSTPGIKSTAKPVKTTASNNSSTSAIVTVQTTQAATTRERTTNKARTTQADTTIKSTTSKAQTTQAATTVKTTTSKAETTQATTSVKSTTDNAETTQETTAPTSTTANTKSNGVTTAPETTDETPKTHARETTVFTKQTTSTVEAGSSIAPETQGTNEPTHTRPTEYRPSSFDPPRNESSLRYRKMEESGSSNVALILVPMLCLLLLAICLVMLFLYRRRNQRRKEKQDREQFVYYESSTKVESVANPLYESAVKFTCDSTENPLYDTGGESAENPLYNAKRQVTDFYAEPCTPREPVMTLESHDLREYENPIYDFTTSSLNESSA